jgi:hypothetical protein
MSVIQKYLPDLNAHLELIKITVNDLETQISDPGKSSEYKWILVGRALKDVLGNLKDMSNTLADAVNDENNNGTECIEPKQASKGITSETKLDDCKMSIHLRNALYDYLSGTRNNGSVAYALRIYFRVI